MPLIVRVPFTVGGSEKKKGDELTFSEEAVVRENPSLLRFCTNTLASVKDADPSVSA